LNGILLVRGDDYTATNGTSITGLSALAASDFVQVNCYNNFSVASVPAQNITGTVTNAQLANSAITINGSAISLGGTVTLAGDIESVTATSPLTGGGSTGALTVGIQEASTSQRGSVQLSDSTSTTSSVLAATPTAVKSAYDLANGAIPKTLTTTTGDIIYASSANTPARLGIGSTDQVLKVSGGVPTWATPTVSTSGMTLISRTSIGNTASVTLDNVFTSAYTNYLLVIDNWFALGATDDLLIRYRTGGSSGTDASSNHYSGSTSNQFQGTTWVNYNVTTAAAFPLVTSSDTTNGIQAVLHFNNIGYSSTYGHVFGNGINGSNQTYFNFMGYNAAGATYTGLRFNSTSSNIYLKASLYGLANS
jgi:hypothetical protein